MKFLKREALIILVLNLSSCGNPFGRDSHLSIDYGPPPIETEPLLKANTPGFGFVGASQLGQSTAATRHIDITAGNTNSKIKLVTSRNRYLLLDIQGQIGSEQ